MTRRHLFKTFAAIPFLSFFGSWFGLRSRPNPIVISAYCSCLNPSIVRLMLTALRAVDVKADQVQASPAQIQAWENVALLTVRHVKATLKTGDPAFMPKPRTMGGIPLVENHALAPTVIYFISERRIVGKIESLAIPTGFANFKMCPDTSHPVSLLGDNHA